GVLVRRPAGQQGRGRLLRHHHPRHQAAGSSRRDHRGEGVRRAGSPIKDLQTTTSKIHFDQNGPLDSLKVNLDIDHTFKGDLVVQLTSPSGKTVDVSNRAGGSAHDIKGDFDLSNQFKGEGLKGDWTLTVKDAAARDEGT